MKATDWQPIETAPSGAPVIVGNRKAWTLARKVRIPTSTLQARWPFIVSGSEWAWVFSCSGDRPIDFAPTHWVQPIFSMPPERHLCDGCDGYECLTECAYPGASATRTDLETGNG